MQNGDFSSILSLVKRGDLSVRTIPGSDLLVKPLCMTINV